MAKASQAPSMFSIIARVAVPISGLCFLLMFASIVLVSIPGAITKYIWPVDKLRSYLLRRLWYYWQLSLEGPLFKIIGVCGRRLGRGSLSSPCRPPKAFKVKVLSTTEMDVAWTPQPPANPFHEEHYIISYCPVSADGTVGDWIERILEDAEYYKKEKADGSSDERIKEIGKAPRRRLHLSDLPEKTAFRLRVCANGPGGQSKWSSEVLTSTFATPDENQGLTGPLATGAPTSVREYRWWQSKHEVGIFVAIPEEWKAKEINVKVISRGDTTDFKMEHGRGMLLAGSLGRNVKVDEVDWSFEKAAGGGKEIALTLKKEKLMEMWECFIDGHQRVDPKLVKLIYEGNSMNELATQDLWE